MLIKRNKSNKNGSSWSNIHFKKYKYKLYKIQIYKKWLLYHLFYMKNFECKYCVLKAVYFNMIK